MLIWPAIMTATSKIIAIVEYIVALLSLERMPVVIVNVNLFALISSIILHSLYNVCSREWVEREKEICYFNRNQ